MFLPFILNSLQRCISQGSIPLRIHNLLLNAFSNRSPRPDFHNSQCLTRVFFTFYILHVDSRSVSLSRSLSPSLPLSVCIYLPIYLFFSLSLTFSFLAPSAFSPFFSSTLHFLCLLPHLHHNSFSYFNTFSVDFVFLSLHI